MISVMLSQAAADAGRYLATVAFSLLAGLGGLLKEWRYRSDIHKLQSLSDRQLSDIGLTRGRIEDAVRGGASRETARNASLRSQFRA
jgi:uncharacterized protein YjiS (DUF1127 family)